MSLPHLAWRTNGILPYLRAPVSFKRLLDGALCTDGTSAARGWEPAPAVGLGSCLWATADGRRCAARQTCVAALERWGPANRSSLESIGARRPASSSYQMN